MKGMILFIPSKNQGEMKFVFEVVLLKCFPHN